MAFEEKLILDAEGENVDEWNWTFDDGTKIKLDSSWVEHIFNYAGLYEVTLVARNLFGCSTNSSFLVLVDEYSFIPNAITPNGDMKNDSFEILYNGEAAVELSIQNRWGKQVYFNKSYQNDWDGGDLPAGVYYYQIRLGRRQYKGPLTIVK